MVMAENGARGRYLPDFDQATTLKFSRFHYGVCVVENDAFPFPTLGATSRNAKEKRLVSIHYLFLPKLVLIKDICGEEFRSHTAGEIFNAFSVIS